MPRFEDVTARMGAISLSPTGKRVLVEARGEIFTIPEEKGDVRNITSSSGSAERAPAWSPDGKWISYFSDKSGEYKLVIESQDGVGTPREIAFEKSAFYYSPAWSPDSKKLLYTDTNLNVWVMDVASGQAKIVGNDPWMVPQRTLNPSWSPDSKYVAYAARLNSLYRAIFVADTAARLAATLILLTLATPLASAALAAATLAATTLTSTALAAAALTAATLAATTLAAAALASTALTAATALATAALAAAALAHTATLILCAVDVFHDCSLSR
jgi:hypothetical protein